MTEIAYAKEIRCGDTVFAYCDTLGRVLEYFVDSITQHYAGKDDILTTYVADAYGADDELLDSIDFEITDIGKTVFLTEDDALLGNLMKLSVPEFIKVMNENADERFEQILDEEGFSVYVDTKYYRFYGVQLEDADDEGSYCELRLAASLTYDVLNDVKNKDDVMLPLLFDCDFSGEYVTDKNLYYLWFKRC